jgi:lipopolysaccharide transport system permease protein
MAKREVVGRYKGSVMGLLWSFLNPIFLLLVYTFFFSVVFKSRWGVSEEESKIQFAVILFVGMIVYGLLADVLNRAPMLILSNVNYVKKVVFPLEILPIIALTSTLFHTLASLSVLLIVFFSLNSFIYWTTIFIPMVLLPLIILSLGISWILASLGVFMRDIGQSIGLFTTALMFLSPVFFSVNSLPKEFQSIIMANPLTFIIEQARDVLIWGKMPDFLGLINYTFIALIVAWLGFIWFQKTRKGFADVL